ncbi:MAG: helix-turn-helix domain-containing protein [Candidatus Gastranaerophilales bacterium]|nr:helix-turn-helix domain-containing protein [Candidatus Gastranaerophilales bacterium]MCM1072383.1 helix-turn-helix domain-containing protein [Bacteroides sp.]
MKHLVKDNLDAFGIHVQKIRKEKSDSLNNIAFTRGGVTSATLSRIENGLVDFKFSTLLNLAYTLDMSLVDLLKDFHYKNSPDE